MSKKINVLHFIKLLICLFLSITLSGCFGGRELNKLTMVTAIGLDKRTENDNVLLTAQIVKPGGKAIFKNKSTSNEDKGYLNTSTNGDTIFEAVRKMTHKTGNRLFVSHCQAIILGNDIAYNGVQNYMDFFNRAVEIRPTTLILISRNTALDILEVMPEIEDLPSMNIKKIARSYIFTSEFKEINLQQFTLRLMSKTTSPVAPLVGISNEGGKKELSVSGMAVFKKDKMIGTLSSAESKGFLWATNGIKGGYIKVASGKEKEDVVFEIMNSKTKVTPQIDGDSININIKIDANTSLAEQKTSKNLAKEDTIEELEKKQEEVIEKEILLAFQKSKELNTDFFGFGDIIHKKYKKQWKVLKENWDEKYKKINIDTDIKVTIRKTNAITAPAVPD